MKNIVLFLASCMLIGCQQKEQQPKYIIVKDEPQTEKKVDIISSEGYTTNDIIEWHGHSYSYHIKKYADRDLPVVKNENGQKFYDNKIELEIKCDDGSTFFSRTFQKTSFEQYMPESFVAKGIMEGLVFDKTDENGCMKFVASVAYPQTDEYVLFSVLLTKDKNITIAKDNSMLE